MRRHIAAIFERWPTMRFDHPDDGRRLEWDGVDVFPRVPGGEAAR